MPRYGGRVRSYAKRTARGYGRVRKGGISRGRRGKAGLGSRRFYRGYRRRSTIGRVGNRSRAFPRVVSYRVSNVLQNIPPGGWKLCMVDSVRPVQLVSLWKAYKVVGAMVAVKRHQPSPIVFDGTQAQVAHQELWWAPWSGVDEPMTHPRQMASAILVGDNWTSKYVRNCVPVSQRFHYDNRDPKGGIEQVIEFFKPGSPPWLPIDGFERDDTGKESGKFAAQQSIGFFYVDGPSNSRVTVDVELKLTIAMKGRKCLGGKLDESGPINPNNAGVSIGNEDIGSNLGADLPVEEGESVN